MTSACRAGCGSASDGHRRWRCCDGHCASWHRASWHRARRPAPRPDRRGVEMPGHPIRRIGSWGELSPEQRRHAVTRGLDKIFDPGLRDDIARLIEDVRLNGDGALVRALKAFDGCDVEASRLRVTEAEFAAARATVSPALLAAIRDGIDHVRRF